MKNVVVTGATGFIGSWLVQELLSNGIATTIIARNKEKLLNEFFLNPKCTIIESDIENLAKHHFVEEHYDVFFHLGWGGVSPEQKNDIKVQLNNISMSIHALEVCKTINCDKFVASGTVAEYVFCSDIMNVNDKQTPNDMYGAAKVSTHYFLEVRARQLQQPFIWMVIPSTFGERRSDNNIITYTIRTLLKNEKPMYGDLTQMWDFLYVAEVVRAIRLIGEKGKAGKIYGIGSGKYKPLKEYICRIRDLINPELELGIGAVPSMTKQTFSSCVNIYDLVCDTGFSAEIDFDEGILRTINYIRNYDFGIQ